MFWVNLFRDCKTFGCLPEAGGLFDQHPLVVQNLRLVQESIAAKEELDNNIQKAEIEKAKNKRK